MWITNKFFLNHSFRKSMYIFSVAGLFVELGGGMEGLYESDKFIETGRKETNQQYKMQTINYLKTSNEKLSSIQYLYT